MTTTTNQERDEAMRETTMKFRKKPVVIEAVQWTGDMLDAETITSFAGDTMIGFHGDKISIITLEGIMEASPGDWVIRGVKGELYPCKPDIFEATYDPVNQ
jgi:hypothetical protein